MCRWGVLLLIQYANLLIFIRICLLLNEKDGFRFRYNSKSQAKPRTIQNSKLKTQNSDGARPNYTIGSDMP